MSVMISAAVRAVSETSFSVLPTYKMIWDEAREVDTPFLPFSLQPYKTIFFLPLPSCMPQSDLPLMSAPFRQPMIRMTVSEKVRIGLRGWVVERCLNASVEQMCIAAA